MNCLLMRESPMIIPLDKEKTVYDGFITVLEKDFRIRISLPPDRQMKQAKLHCCWQMKRLLHGYQQIVKQRLQHSTNLMAFILELRTVLEVALKSQPGCHSFSPPQYYSQLITEIEILGWDNFTLSSMACVYANMPNVPSPFMRGADFLVANVMLSSMLPARHQAVKLFQSTEVNASKA